jgi:hypothetical protein
MPRLRGAHAGRVPRSNRGQTPRQLIIQIAGWSTGTPEERIARCLETWRATPNGYTLRLTRWWDHATEAQRKAVLAKIRREIE